MDYICFLFSLKHWKQQMIQDLCCTFATIQIYWFRSTAKLCTAWISIVELDQGKGERRLEENWQVELRESIHELTIRNHEPTALLLYMEFINRISLTST